MNTTYEKILNLTDQLIGQSGFQGFSYADLAKQLGITKASIHHHFATKADLGIAYCQQKLSAFHTLSLAINAQPAGEKQLQAYFDGFNGCASDRLMCGVFAMQTDAFTMPEALQDALAEVVNYEQKLVAHILEQGQAAGQFELKVSPQQQAMIVCCALKGALMLNRQRAGAFKETKESLLAALVK